MRLAVNSCLNRSCRRHINAVHKYTFFVIRRKFCSHHRSCNYEPRFTSKLFFRDFATSRHLSLFSLFGLHGQFDQGLRPRRISQRGSISGIHFNGLWNFPSYWLILDPAGISQRWSSILFDWEWNIIPKNCSSLVLAMMVGSHRWSFKRCFCRKRCKILIRWWWPFLLIALIFRL